MQDNRYILHITPQTWVRINSGKHGDQALFNIPEVCRKIEGEPCEDFIRDGECKHALSKHGKARKRRIERYNKYRVDLFDLAKQAGFMLPSCGWAVYFYFPMPKRWPKKKKLAMHGQLHLQQPDYDNCLKAFGDSLAVSDHQIAQQSGTGKFWVNQEAGYIEILTNQPVYNPFNVVLIDQDRLLSMSDLEERRVKKEARKKEIREEKKKKKEKVTRNPKPLKLLQQKELFKKEEKLK